MAENKCGGRKTESVKVLLIIRQQSKIPGKSVNWLVVIKFDTFPILLKQARQSESGPVSLEQLVPVLQLSLEQIVKVPA